MLPVWTLRLLWQVLRVWPLRWLWLRFMWCSPSVVVCAGLYNGDFYNEGGCYVGVAPEGKGEWRRPAAPERPPERRQWAATTLASDRQMNAKLIFIEVIVNQPNLVEANIRAKRRALEAAACVAEVGERAGGAVDAPAVAAVEAVNPRQTQVAAAQPGERLGGSVGESVKLHTVKMVGFLAKTMAALCAHGAVRQASGTLVLGLY